MLWNNTTAAQPDVNGGEWSFEFNAFDFDVFVFAGQNGVIFTNGAYLCKGDLRMVGNFLTSNTGPLSTAALTLTGSGGVYHSHIADSRIAIELESNGGNTYAPQTINSASAASWPAAPAR